MGHFPLLHCTPLIHIYTPGKHMVPDKEENHPISMGGRWEGGDEGWVQGAYVKSRLKVKTQEARGGGALPGASDRLKTFFRSLLGPEPEIPACHQSHSIWCQEHVPKSRGRQKTPWLTTPSLWRCLMPPSLHLSPSCTLYNSQAFRPSERGGFFLPNSLLQG